MTVDVARRYGDAVDEGDWETARALLHPDVEITRPSGRRYRGADDWIRRLTRARGFRNLDTECESRAYEEREGGIVEVKEIVHRWSHDGSLAYRSHEETEVTVRDGLIAGLSSTVEHREPELREAAGA